MCQSQLLLISRILVKPFIELAVRNNAFLWHHLADLLIAVVADGNSGRLDIVFRLVGRNTVVNCGFVIHKSILKSLLKGLLFCGRVLFSGPVALVEIVAHAREVILNEMTRILIRLHLAGFQSVRELGQGDFASQWKLLEMTLARRGGHGGFHFALEGLLIIHADAHVALIQRNNPLGFLFQLGLGHHWDECYDQRKRQQVGEQEAKLEESAHGGGSRKKGHILA